MLHGDRDARREVSSEGGGYVCVYSCAYGVDGWWGRATAGKSNDPTHTTPTTHSNRYRCETKCRNTLQPAKRYALLLSSCTPHPIYTHLPAHTQPHLLDTHTPHSRFLLGRVPPLLCIQLKRFSFFSAWLNHDGVWGVCSRGCHLHALTADQNQPHILTKPTNHTPIRYPTNQQATSAASSPTPWSTPSGSTSPPTAPSNTCVGRRFWFVVDWRMMRVGYILNTQQYTSQSIQKREEHLKKVEGELFGVIVHQVNMQFTACHVFVGCILYLHASPLSQQHKPKPTHTGHVPQLGPLLRLRQEPHVAAVVPVQRRVGPAGQPAGGAGAAEGGLHGGWVERVERRRRRLYLSCRAVSCRVVSWGVCITLDHRPSPAAPAHLYTHIHTHTTQLFYRTHYVLEPNRQPAAAAAAPAKIGKKPRLDPTTGNGSGSEEEGKAGANGGQGNGNGYHHQPPTNGAGNGHGPPHAGGGGDGSAGAVLIGPQLPPGMARPPPPPPEGDGGGGGKAMGNRSGRKR